MKKTTFTILLALFSSVLFAQKWAYVNTEYILEKIPAYKEAKRQLDNISQRYQKEIEEIYSEADKLYKAYQNDKVLLSEEMRKKREQEIVEKENQAKKLQKKYFGKNGELFQKRQELIKPIQDEVYEAVKEIAGERNYALIIDTAAGATVLYSDPRYDKSDEVLKKLGYRN